MPKTTKMGGANGRTKIGFLKTKHNSSSRKSAKSVHQMNSEDLQTKAKAGGKYGQVARNELVRRGFQVGPAKSYYLAA